jgi:hypothetical protein
MSVDGFAQPLIALISVAADAFFVRREQLTPVDATGIRLAALTLAAEANREHRPSTDAFRTIAAGVTLLERRITGQPSREVLIVARA